MASDMDEIWKDVHDYKGLYKVSNYGNVKALQKVLISNFTNTDYIVRKEKVLKAGTDSLGYKSVVLTKNNISKSHRVHRLMMISFFGYSEFKNYVNHKNGIKSDNRIDNLEWMTNSENILHGFRTRKNK